MSASLLAPYEVQAYNVAHASENKIHDDTVALRLGFSGGLVPGVEVFVYASHFPVTLWGRDWLTRGTMSIRLMKPLYDGKRAVVTAAETDAGLDFQVESDGALCATGSASLPPEAPATPDLSAFPLVSVRDPRPPASVDALPPGAFLCTNPLDVTPGYASDYLHDAREGIALYADEAIVHPGIMLRMCNWTLSHNVLMGAWIHMGSTVQNLAPAAVGDALTGRARIVANYERKGHKMVDLDVLVIANGRTPIARVAHTAIYLPRQLAEAS